MGEFENGADPDVYIELGVRSWPISAPGEYNLRVRFVPEAEVNPGKLNDR